MSIEVTSLPDAEPRPRHVAIGTFDGVHLGHQAVIDDADTVLTFDPHPLEVLHPAALPKLIMPFAVKRDVIDGLGVRGAGRDPLRPASSPSRSAEDFIEHVLIERLGAEQGLGRRELPLRRQGQGRPGDAARAAPSSRPGWCRWSRSTARPSPRPGSGPWSRPATWRARGTASAPRSWSRATVVKGDQRGRELGFPTANIVPDDRLAIPGHGVYAAFADGVPAAVNVGVRPTFETGRGVLIETYLIDRDEDLYGKTLRVAFVERLRGEKRFAEVEELIAQMHRDVEDAKRVCASFQRP